MGIALPLDRVPATGALWMPLSAMLRMSKTSAWNSDSLFGAAAQPRVLSRHVLWLGRACGICRPTHRA